MSLPLRLSVSAARVTSRGCLLIKDSYWRWPAHDKAGNAIDFFVQVLGLSFHDAMRIITTSLEQQRS